MTHHPRFALVTFLLVAASGCVTTNATRLGSGAIFGTGVERKGRAIAIFVLPADGTR